MTDIKSEDQLKLYLTKKADTAIERVSQRVLKLLKQNIEKYTYRLEYYPNRIYLDGSGGIPTRQFLNAWVWDNVKPTVDGLCKELWYDYSNMDTEDNSWFHNSRIKGWEGDSSPYLNEILNVDGYTSNLWVGRPETGRMFSKLRKPYWDITINELDSGEIWNMFDEEMNKLGFQRF